MKNPINISIKTPCNENFETFVTTKNGGFCDSCQKEVIDFIQMSSQEIIKYFQNKESLNTCGRFKETQIQHVSSTNNKRLRFVSGLGFALLSLFSLGSIQAQVKPENVTSEIQNSKIDQTMIVKGQVTESSNPLPGVNILLEGTTYGTQTDLNGYFEFPRSLKKGDVLIFSYLGYESQKIVIDNKNSASNIKLKVDMNTIECVIMGEVAVKKPYKSKRN